MKEKDLVKLGMVKQEVSEEESGGPAYHYYSWDPYERSRFGLISSASDDKSVVKRDEWVVYVFDDDGLEYDNAEDLRVLMDGLKRGVKKKKQKTNRK